MAMPAPMVPAPITAARRIGSALTCAPRPGILRASRSAKKTCTSARRCGLSRHSMKYPRSRANAASFGSVQAASMLSTILQGASCPRALGSSRRRNAANSSGLTSRMRSVRSLAIRSGRRSPAARRASASAPASAGSASSSTSPSSSAREALRWAPEVMASSAACGPARRVKRCVPPAPGISPSFTSGRPTLALAAATRQWQASASSKPPPRATPSIAATMGFVPASIFACTSRVMGDFSTRPEATSLISAPAANVPSAPVTTTERTARSCSARCSPCSSPSRTARLRAFTGGLAIVSTATSPSRR